MQQNTISTLARRRDSRHGTALLPASAWQAAPLVWRLGVLRADGSLDDMAGIPGISLRVVTLGGTRPGETLWLEKTVPAAHFRAPAAAAAVAAGTDWHAQWDLDAEETLLPVETTGTRTYWYEFRAGDGTVLAAGQLVVRAGAGSDGAFLRVGALATYADNAAAVTGGLAAGTFYQTPSGEVRIVITAPPARTLTNNGETLTNNGVALTNNGTGGSNLTVPLTNNGEPLTNNGQPLTNQPS